MKLLENVTLPLKQFFAIPQALRLEGGVQEELSQKVNGYRSCRTEIQPNEITQDPFNFHIAKYHKMYVNQW